MTEPDEPDARRRLGLARDIAKSLPRQGRAAPRSAQAPRAPGQAGPRQRATSRARSPTCWARSSTTRAGTSSSPRSGCSPTGPSIVGPEVAQHSEVIAFDDAEVAGRAPTRRRGPPSCGCWHRASWPSSTSCWATARCCASTSAARRRRHGRRALARSAVPARARATPTAKPTSRRVESFHGKLVVERQHCCRGHDEHGRHGGDGAEHERRLGEPDPAVRRAHADRDQEGQRGAAPQRAALTNVPVARRARTVHAPPRRRPSRAG